MAKFAFNTDDKGNITPAERKPGLVIPMLSREIKTDNDTNLPTWLGVMTQEGLFNFEINTNSPYAEEIRGEAMIISEDPTEMGCDVELQGNKVYYEDTVVGRRLSYDLKPVPLEDPASEAVQLVMKMNRSKRLVMTNNKVAGYGTQGGNFVAHGRTFLNNFADIKNQPDGRARLKLYFMFVNWLYLDAVSVDWGTPEISAKPGHGEKSEKASFLIDRMVAIWTGVEEAPGENEEEETPKQSAENAAQEAGLD